MKQTTQPTTRRYFSCFFAAAESITHQTNTNNGTQKTHTGRGK